MFHQVADGAGSVLGGKRAPGADDADTALPRQRARPRLGHVERFQPTAGGRSEPGVVGEWYCSFLGQGSVIRV